MCAPERLNVLLSRARDALIMIGNAETFSNARRGKELWSNLFKMMRQDGHIYDGFPTKCERHPTRTSILKRPVDFEEHCPDGGCTERWCVFRSSIRVVMLNTLYSTSMLNCGIHQCPSKCHQLYDHSKMECAFLMDLTCANGHRRTYTCHQGPPVKCVKCEKAAEAAEEQRRKDFEKQQKRDEEQKEHARRIAALDAEIEAELEAQRERERARQRSDALVQKQRDLADAKARTARKAAVRAPVTPTPASQDTAGPSPTLRAPTIPDPAPEPASSDEGESDSTSSQLPGTASPSPPTSDAPDQAPTTPTIEDNTSSPLPPSKSEEEWQRQKDMEGASNAHIDAIMEMTGLEDVKAQVLRIKAKIDVSQRQGMTVYIGHKYDVSFRT